MQFNSYIFILVFLPVFVIGYFLLGRIKNIFGKLFVILAGAVFYAYGGWDASFVLLASIILNYCLAVLITKLRAYGKVILFIAVTANAALLLYFKYFNFALLSIGSVLNREFQLKDLILPLGISFFTFQQIMYVVSVYREETGIDLADYLAYILYFPKLIMGPLVKPAELISQLNDDRRYRPCAENIAAGLKLFCIGFFKKMVIADTFSAAAAWGYGNYTAATSLDMLLVILFYTFEIYFDFSGYTDMAIGISSMINIDLPMNFDSPYKAVSIRDFWKRWHISLTRFLTEYIYFPLGGSRKGAARTYVNIMIVFLISGLWHGANYTFILWGALHGMLQVIERLAGRAFDKIAKPIRWLYSFISVSILWLLFGAGNITQWKDMLVKAFSFKNMTVSDGLLNAFLLPEMTFMTDFLGLSKITAVHPLYGLTVFAAAAFAICLIPENAHRNMKKLSALSVAACSIAFVWAFLCLSSESVFVYFNF